MHTKKNILGDGIPSLAWYESWRYY